ncbi:unnamed protein product [Rhodiola kirilowii]
MWKTEKHEAGARRRRRRGLQWVVEVLMASEEVQERAEVDVRIIDDEVTIKLVQRKRVNCLLLVSKILDELQLDSQHAAGGHTGDFYSYLFNTKIYEGSTVYATGIANRLMEAVERQYAALPTT